MMSETTLTALKAIAYSGYLGAIFIFDFLNILNWQIGILGLLMILDFLTGLARQYIINPIEIQSFKAKAGLIKKFLVLMGIMSIALMFKGLDINGAIYLKSAISILIMAETYSLVRNIYIAKTGKEIPEFDVVSILLKKFLDTLQKSVEDKLK